jgi:hypothetical protein
MDLDSTPHYAMYKHYVDVSARGKTTVKKCGIIKTITT